MPDLIPRSYPPPEIREGNLIFGFLLRYIAPTPFGPYILCAVIDNKSIFICSTSMRNFPID